MNKKEYMIGKDKLINVKMNNEPSLTIWFYKGNAALKTIKQI